MLVIGQMCLHSILFLKKSIICFLNPDVNNYLLLYLNCHHLFKVDKKCEMAIFLNLSQTT